MGRISDSLEKHASLPSSPTDGGRSGHLWEQIFGSVSKEEKPAFPPVRGGTYGRSVFSSDAATKRLLQAFRSMAPGGWSDNRWEQSKHFVGIQYVAGHRKYEQLSRADFQLFIRDDNEQDGKKPVPRWHPSYQLIKLLEKPNPEDSFGDLLYRWAQQMDLTGKALTWMVPNKLGVPMELYPIPTAIAIPQPAVNPDYPDGYYRIQPIYPYGPFSSYPTPTTAVGAPIPAQWMMEFKFPHPLLRYDGYSPLTALRLHIDEIESIDRSRWYSMKRVVKPSAVLNFDEMEGAQPLPEEEIDRIRSDFENEQQGPENQGRLFVATPGAKLEQWGSSPVDMEYQQGWEQLVSFVMAGLGITKPAAGMMDNSSYAALFATLKQLHLLTLEPMCERFASRLTRRLAPFFGDDLIVEIRCPRIDDQDMKHAKLNLAMQGKSLTKNELRVALELPPTREPWGNEIAGMEPPPEQQMAAGAMPGMPGVPGMPGAPGAPGAAQAAPGGAGQAPQGPQAPAAPAPEKPQLSPIMADGTPIPDAETGVPLGETPSSPIPEAEQEATRVEPVEMTRERPITRKLGRGAMGAKKSLSIPKRSLYDEVRKSLSNSDHKEESKVRVFSLGEELRSAISSHETDSSQKENAFTLGESMRKAILENKDGTNGHVQTV